MESLESVIQDCGRRRALNEGRQVHHLIRQRGLEQDRLLANLLIQMYGKCADVSSSLSVFHSLPSPNVFSWTIMLEAFAENGHLHDAVDLFESMPQRNVASWTTMIKVYAIFSRIDQARDIFNRMPERNVTSWNAMLSAYATEGDGAQASGIFMSMSLEGIKGNPVTFIILLNATAKSISLAQAKLLHGVAASAGMTAEVRVCNALVNLYGHCSAPDISKRIFDEMPMKSTVTWNSMMSVHVRNSQLEMAEELFSKMDQPDIVSWNTIISAYDTCPRSSLTMFRRMCLSGTKPDKITFLHILRSFTNPNHLVTCRSLHAILSESEYRDNVAVGTALICSYSRCGSLADARRILDSMAPEPDVVAWTAMITSLAHHHGHAKEALELLTLMDIQGASPSEVTLLGALDACASLGNLSQGKLLHSALSEAGMDTSGILGNSLIDMYGWCGSTGDAWESFNVVVSRSPGETVAWNSMVGALSRNSHNREAVNLFRVMNLEGVKPEGITIVNVLDSCSVSEGEVIHSTLAGSGLLETDIKLQNALITMYAEGGSLGRARRVFDGISKPNSVSWSAVITAYLGHGSNSEGWRLFQWMRQEGESPDRVTFTAMLSACAHAGVWEDGWRMFLGMQQDHFIAPVEDHFMCMADLLGRTGKLQEAEDVLNGMPVEPSVVAWTSLLACCRTGRDSERGDRVSEIVLRMKARSSGAYILLSEISVNSFKYGN